MADMFELFELLLVITDSLWRNKISLPIHHNLKIKYFVFQFWPADQEPQKS